VGRVGGGGTCGSCAPSRRRAWASMGSRGPVACASTAPLLRRGRGTVPCCALLLPRVSQVTRTAYPSRRHRHAFIRVTRTCTSESHAPVHPSHTHLYIRVTRTCTSESHAPVHPSHTHLYIRVTHTCTSESCVSHGSYRPGPAAGSKSASSFAAAPLLPYLARASTCTRPALVRIRRLRAGCRCRGNDAAQVHLRI
jgi:hypothetical protein